MAASSRDESDRVARTRRRIHEAAMRAFAEHGRAASIDDINAIAGIARGTFYNYYRTVEELFESVAAELAHDMTTRTYPALLLIADPALRTSNGIRLFCQRAHVERDWGLFVANFAMTAQTLQVSLRETALRDLQEGIALGRFKITSDQELCALALITGGTTGAMRLIASGLETPQRAGENITELLLRGLGVAPVEARALARSPLIEIKNLDSAQTRSKSPARAESAAPARRAVKKPSTRR